jgi:hypothetical protein
MNRKQKIILYIFICIVVFILTLPLPTVYGSKGRIAQAIVIATMIGFWPKRLKEKKKDKQNNK